MHSTHDQHKRLRRPQWPGGALLWESLIDTKLNVFNRRACSYLAVVRNLGRPLAYAFSVAAVVGLRWDVVASDPHAMFARERAASGGDAWRAVVAIRTTGTVIQGGAADRLSEVVDRRTGWSKSITDFGSLREISGFDGVAWDFQGGAVTQQTLLGMRADNLTQAYVSRDGWWNRNDPATMMPIESAGVRVTPRGGSPIDVWFNPQTGLIARTIAHTDYGDVSQVRDDYRTVGDVIVPFHVDSRDATNAETITSLKNATLLTTVSRAAFERPQPLSVGHIIGSGASAVVPFHLNGPRGFIIADVRVGASAAKVIFDSGGANYFTPAGARALSLHGAGGIELGGVGNASSNGSIAAAPSISLGNAVLSAQHAIIGPLPFAAVRAEKGLNVAGLVGAEFLESFRCEFDFVAGHMIFSGFRSPVPTPRGAVVLPMLSDGQHAYVRATIDGVAGTYLLDTGDAGDITIFRRFANAHGLFRKPGVAYVSSGGVGGHLAYSRYRALSFTLGGATMKRPPVEVPDASAGTFASRSVAGNIGLRVISRYDILIDFRRSTVTLVPNRRFTTPFPVDRSGFTLEQTSAAGFVILSVVARSPAAQAGLKVGDHIAAFAGRNISTGALSLNDLQEYSTGTRAYTLTILSANKSKHTLIVHPRDLIPPML